MQLADAISKFSHGVFQTALAGAQSVGQEFSDRRSVFFWRIHVCCPGTESITDQLDVQMPMSTGKF